jgi:Domain of unknown function (DUF4390)
VRAQSLSLTLSLSLFLTAAALAAPQAKIENLSAIAANGKVSVRFSLAGAFASGEMVEALQSGVPTSISYAVEIFRDHPNWFDDGIAGVRLEVICTFNSVTREYLLNYRRDRRLVRSETFTDLAMLQERMANVEEVDLFDIGPRKSYKLKVRVKADLMRGWVMYVIPWEVSTKGRETRVKTAEQRKPERSPDRLPERKTQP